MAAWRDIAGGCRGRNNCWRRSGWRAKSGSRIAPRLLAGLHARGVFGPIGLELCIVDLEVLHHVRIFHKEVVASAGLEKLLLNGQPGRLVHPHLNLGYLVANLFGLGVSSR